MNAIWLLQPAAVGRAAAPSINPAAPHPHVICPGSASTGRETLDPIDGAHAGQLVKAKRLLQTRHCGSTLNRRHKGKKLQKRRRD